MKAPWHESAVCWICDNGLFLIAVLLLALLAITRLGGEKPTIGPATPTPVPVFAPTTSPLSPTDVISPRPTGTGSARIPDTPVVTITPSVLETLTPGPPTKPVFVVAFIPVLWQSGPTAFERAARNQLNLFIANSLIDQYFDVQIVILESGPEGVSLLSELVFHQVLAYGLEAQPADRYVGLTDGDFVLEGESEIIGWTYGVDSLLVLGEARFDYVVSHELGHTFGLCDEYSFDYWQSQNEQYEAGCPNLFPESCSRTTMCPGEPGFDGNPSIMGPGSSSGLYSFNLASLEHLQRVFADMAAEGDRQ